MASRKRVRYTFDIHFDDKEEKDAFQARLKHIRDRLSTTEKSSKTMDNRSFMNLCLDALESTTSGVRNNHSDDTMITKSFMRNSGQCNTS